MNLLSEIVPLQLNSSLKRSDKQFNENRSEIIETLAYKLNFPGFKIIIATNNIYLSFLNQIGNYRV